MYILSPSAVQLRELHRQDLLDMAARERLARAGGAGTTPQMSVNVSPNSVAASVRSKVLSRLALLGRFARVAVTTARPRYRVLFWS